MVNHLLRSLVKKKNFENYFLTNIFFLIYFSYLAFQQAANGGASFNYTSYFFQPSADLTSFLFRNITDNQSTISYNTYDFVIGSFGLTPFSLSEYTPANAITGLGAISDDGSIILVFTTYFSGTPPTQLHFNIDYYSVIFGNDPVYVTTVTDIIQLGGNNAPFPIYTVIDSANQYVYLSYYTSNPNNSFFLAKIYIGDSSKISLIYNYPVSNALTPFNHNNPFTYRNFVIADNAGYKGRSIFLSNPLDPNFYCLLENSNGTELYLKQIIQNNFPNFLTIPGEIITIQKPMENNNNCILQIIIANQYTPPRVFSFNFSDYIWEYTGLLTNLNINNETVSSQMLAISKNNKFLASLDVYNVSSILLQTTV